MKLIRPMDSLKDKSSSDAAIDDLPVWRPEGRDFLESQLEAVKGLRKDLEISQLEIVKQTKKTARILDRISLGENEALA